MLKAGAITVAMIVLGCVGFVSHAKASTIGFQFNATLQTGALAGMQFSGTGSYDNTGETGVGTEYFSLTALDFSVDGVTFNRSGIGQGGQAILVNGLLNYFTAAYFPQTGPISDIALGFGGPGIIGYAVPPGFSNPGAGVYTLTTAPVPEPAAWLLSGMGLVGCCLLARVQKGFHSAASFASVS